MHLWATSKLGDEIAAEQVSPRDKVGYFVVAQVLVVAIGYAVNYVPSHGSWLYVYEAVVVVVITFAGAYRVASSYKQPVDGAFFEAAYLLSIPLIIKTTLASWAVIYGGYWLLGAIAPHINASADSSQALTYWLGRLWEIFPFLVAVSITLIYWFRLAHHVAQVVAKRGA